MKTNYYLSTIILTLIAVFKLQSQSYFSFPDSNCVWSVEKEKHLIKGDSVFNAKTYKKYYWTTDTTLTSINLNFVGLVRQDIINKKIYAIEKTQTVETLLYDFNLNLNDTLSVEPIYSIFYQSPRRIKVTAIDSVIINGQYRKRFTIASNRPFGPSITETWIEGIGSSFGPLCPGLADPPIICPCFPTLLCQKVNNQTIYVEIVNNSCYKTICTGVGINNIAVDNKILIFPNPTNCFAKIELPEKIMEIKIYDSKSQLINNIQFDSENKLIDLTKVKDGIYFIKIITETRTVETKLIKNGY
jgi:hypothetical protein